MQGFLSWSVLSLKFESIALGNGTSAKHKRIQSLHFRNRQPRRARESTNKGHWDWRPSWYFVSLVVHEFRRSYRETTESLANPTIPSSWGILLIGPWPIGKTIRNTL